MRIFLGVLLWGLSWSLFCQEPLRLTFTGDLMAYKKNQSMPDYRDIYAGVEKVLKADDLSFINMESPLDPWREQLSYPSFNAHPEYLEAAVRAGFDVFSLANNHANDYGVSSIMASRRVLENLHRVYPLSWSGYRNYPSEPVRPTVIWKNGWKIGFVALTNLINVKPGSQFLYYTPWWSIWDDRGNPEAEEQLLNQVAAWKDQVDLLVLSLHDGQEYQKEPSAVQKVFYQKLVRAGVDILWGTHPHVLQPWAWVETDRGKRLILFSMGNFLTYQEFRTVDSDEDRARGGDGALFSLTVRRVAGWTQLSDIQILLTNNYLDPVKGVVIRPTRELMKLPRPWGPYFTRRWAVQQAFLKPENLQP